VLIDEGVLHRPVASASAMADQLDHLLAMSRRRNVTVQVARAKDSLAGMFGAFDLASGPELADTMRMSAVADQTTDSAKLVREAAVAFELVRGRALDTESSRAVIMEAMEQWKS
jgi:hypothetical protein